MTPSHERDRVACPIRIAGNDAQPSAKTAAAMSAAAMSAGEAACTAMSAGEA